MFRGALPRHLLNGVALCAGSPGDDRQAVPYVRRITDAMEYELASLEKAMGPVSASAGATSKNPE